MVGCDGYVFEMVIAGLMSEMGSYWFASHTNHSQVARDPSPRAHPITQEEYLRKSKQTFSDGIGFFLFFSISNDIAMLLVEGGKNET